MAETPQPAAEVTKKKKATVRISLPPKHSDNKQTIRIDLPAGGAGAAAPGAPVQPVTPVSSPAAPNIPTAPVSAAATAVVTTASAAPTPVPQGVPTSDKAPEPGAPGVAAPVAAPPGGMLGGGQLAPATEEIPTKPPVAAMPMPSADLSAGSPVAAPVASAALGKHPADPSKLDMILAIVAALVVIGMVAVLYLKVLGPLGGE